MIFVDNLNITDPTINLALEEYLLRHVQNGSDILLFYINEPSIIIGRHQNILEEINSDYVQEHTIHVVRRLSGGGAVYHDLGNLNFSFLTPYHKDELQNLKKFTQPVVNALQKMGLDAALNSRNDILLNGYKISGNAQYITGQRMVSHGTLLFNSDLSGVNEALKVKTNAISSKGIKSTRSQVANIAEYLKEPMDITTFRSRLLQDLFDSDGEIEQYHLNSVDWQAVHALADERYRNWEWNYGRSPNFKVQKTHLFSFGELTVNIEVEGGLIKEIRFNPDSLMQADPTQLVQSLSGIRYTKNVLEQALRPIDLSFYFNGLTCQELLDLLI